MPSVIARLDTEADKNPFERWQMCCSFVLEDMPRDTLAMCFVWLSTEVGELVQLIEWPRHSTSRKINVAKVQPFAHTSWQFGFAFMLIILLDGSFSLGMPYLFVSCKISTWDRLEANLAVLVALFLSGRKSHKRVDV